MNSTASSQTATRIERLASRQIPMKRSSVATATIPTCQGDQAERKQVDRLYR